jgi:hypothetical protein
MCVKASSTPYGSEIRFRNFLANGEKKKMDLIPNRQSLTTKRRSNHLRLSSARKLDDAHARKI